MSHPSEYPPPCPPPNRPYFRRCPAERSTVSEQLARASKNGLDIQQKLRGAALCEQARPTSSSAVSMSSQQPGLLVRPKSRLPAALCRPTAACRRWARCASLSGGSKYQRRIAAVSDGGTLRVARSDCRRYRTMPPQGRRAPERAIHRLAVIASPALPARTRPQWRRSVTHCRTRRVRAMPRQCRQTCRAGAVGQRSGAVMNPGPTDGNRGDCHCRCRQPQTGGKSGISGTWVQAGALTDVGNRECGRFSMFGGVPSAWSAALPASRKIPMTRRSSVFWLSSSPCAPGLVFSQICSSFPRLSLSVTSRGTKLAARRVSLISCRRRCPRFNSKKRRLRVFFAGRA